MLPKPAMAAAVGATDEVNHHAEAGLVLFSISFPPFIFSERVSCPVHIKGAGIVSLLKQALPLVNSDLPDKRKATDKTSAAQLLLRPPVKATANNTQHKLRD